MLITILSKIKKFSMAIMIVHIAMLFLPTFIRWNVQAGQISEQHSIFNMLFMGIKPFTVILFILTIIVAFLCEKILAQLLSVNVATLLQGVAIIINLILLFVLRSGYLNEFYPVGDTTVGFWYYSIVDVVLAISIFMSYLSNQDTDTTA